MLKPRSPSARRCSISEKSGRRNKPVTAEKAARRFGDMFDWPRADVEPLSEFKYTTATQRQQRGDRLKSAPVAEYEAP